MNNLLKHPRGITYTHDAKIADDYAMKQFEYTCRDHVTNTIHSGIVFCWSRYQFCELINHWNNNERWHYWGKI